MAGALEGFTIVDVCRAGPGEMATGILADYGADVISIVEPGHAQARAQHGAVPAGFGMTKQRNKRSMLLNLRAEGAHDVFMKMVKNADAVMESNRPGAAKRMGVDYETVRKVNPSVIYCSLTGYGQYGPYKNLPGHDIAYQGVGGMIPQDEEGNLMMPSSNQADLNAAWNGALALLIGLLSRSKTGKGQFVDVAFSDASITLSPGRPRDEGMRGYYPSYNIYQTADGKYITLSIREPWFWERLCKAVGHEEWTTYPRPQGKMREEMLTTLRGIFKTKSQQEWLKILSEADTMVAVVNATIDEVISDPHNKARDMIIEAKDPLTGETKHEMGFVLKYADTPATVRRGPTIVGTDTEDILKELGYSSRDITKLREKGVIG